LHCSQLCKEGQAQFHSEELVGEIFGSDRYPRKIRISTDIFPLSFVAEG
jgi:hypothetical protein